MEEGRVKKLANGSLQYQYTINDHLGNTRVMFADVDNNGTIDPNTEILQEDHYYAFGLRIEGLSSYNKDNKFTYNGKELEDNHGLNWYHYGARYYDPALGKWHSVDPVDEMLSPYSYAKNNPILYLDPDGSKIRISAAVLDLILNECKNDKDVKQAVKMFLAVYGKGGILEDVDVTIKYDKNNTTPGTTILYGNTSKIQVYQNIKGEQLAILNRENDYGMEIILNPRKGWNTNKNGGAKTIVAEISHSLYNAYGIEEARLSLSGESIIFWGESQDGFIIHTGNKGAAVDMFNRLRELLMQNEQGDINLEDIEYWSPEILDKYNINIY